MSVHRARFNLDALGFIRVWAQLESVAVLSRDEPPRSGSHYHSTRIPIPNWTDSEINSDYRHLNNTVALLSNILSSRTAPPSSSSPISRPTSPPATPPLHPSRYTQMIDPPPAPPMNHMEYWWTKYRYTTGLVTEVCLFTFALSRTSHVLPSVGI